MPLLDKNKMRRKELMQSQVLMLVTLLVLQLLKKPIKNFLTGEEEMVLLIQETKEDMLILKMKITLERNTEQELLFPNW